MATDIFDMIKSQNEARNRSAANDLYQVESSRARRLAAMQKQADADTLPQRTYDARMAQGEADIQLAQKADEAGFEVSGNGKVGGRRYGGAGGVGNEQAANAFVEGLKEGGVTNPYALAAALGHAQIESRFDTTAIGDKGTSFGSWQWRKERRDALTRFAKANNINADDPKLQGKFAAWEVLNGPERDKGLNNARNLQEANDTMIRVLRPQGSQHGPRNALHYNERSAATMQWYNKLNGFNGGGGGTRTARGPKVAPPPQIGTDEKGEYEAVYVNEGQIGRLTQNNPELAKNFQIWHDGPVNSRGQLPYKRYKTQASTPEGTKPGAVVAEAEAKNVEKPFDPMTGE